MKESLAALATVLVVLAAIPVGTAGLAVTADVVIDSTDSQNAQAAHNGSANGTVSPGAHFSGVVGRQQADIEGEVEARAFGHAVASAASNRSKAGVVASQLARMRDRLSHLEERVRDLQAAHRNGSLDRGAYAAQLAEVVARIQSVEHLANQSARVSSWLPAEARAARGIEQSEIDSLQRDARSITGSNVSVVARSVGGVVDDGFTPPGLRGEDPGRPWTVPVPGRNGTGPPGPPDDVTDGIDDVTDPVENATDDVENATGGVGNGTNDLGNVTDPVDDVVDNATDEVGDAVDDATDGVGDVTDPVDETEDVVENTTDEVDDVTDPVENATDEVGNATDDLGNVTDPVDDAVDNVTDGVDNATGEVGDVVENTTDSTDNVTDPVDDVVDDVTDNSTDSVDDGTDDGSDSIDDAVDDVTDEVENTTDTNENETDDGSGLLGSLAYSFSSTGSIGVDGTNTSGQSAIDSSSVGHVVVARSM